MNKITLALIMLGLQFSFAQNIFPSSGDVSIGTLNPVSKLTVNGSVAISSGLDNTYDRPLISAGTLGNGEIRGFNGSYPVADDGFLRLSAGGGTNFYTKSYIDLTGYSTKTDMNGNIVFGTWGTERMRIDSNGNIGIGTKNASSYEHGGNNKFLEIFNNNTSSNSQSHIILSSGSVISNSSLGTISWTSPNVTSPNKGLAYIGVSSGINSTVTNPSASIIFATRAGTQNFWTANMILSDVGNLGIGTTTPDSKLTVAGNIHAREVKVTTTAGNVPDYVFADDYKLKTLKEVEDYIRVNSHLPEIPSAKEIEKNGLMLAEMNLNLLKKIEEMTLYMIDFKKELENLKNENKIQKEEIAKLRRNNL